MKKKKQPFTQSLIRLCYLMVQNPSVHKDSKDGKIAHKTEQLRAMNYPENTCVYPILRLVGRHSHQRKGQHKNGDHAGSQPLVWAQGEQGKPITKMNTARCKQLNTCQNCVQISPEIIRRQGLPGSCGSGVCPGHGDTG